MVNNQFITVLIFCISAVSSPSFAQCENKRSLLETAITRIFYELEDIDYGAWRGLKIGADSEAAILYLRTHGVNEIEIFSDYFYATHRCPDEIDKIKNNELIYISGKLNGEVLIKNGMTEYFQIKNDKNDYFHKKMSVFEIKNLLKKILLEDKNIAIYPLPYCKKNCIFNIDDIDNIKYTDDWKIITNDGGILRIYFENKKIKKINYIRQKFKGDGVF